jgi:hypothetical protein
MRGRSLLVCLAWFLKGITMRAKLALLFLISMSPSAVGAQLQTLAGKTVSGELVSASDKEIVFQTIAGPLKVPVAEVLLIDLQHEIIAPSGYKYSDVELVDGTLVHCSQVTFAGKEVELKLAAPEQTVRVPFAAISYVLNNADDPALRQEWQEKVMAKRSHRDILAVKLNGVLNPLEGTLGEGQEKGKISFEYESRGARKKPDLDPARVQGMVFLRNPDQDAPLTLCRVLDVHQNVVAAAKLQMTPSNFIVTTVTGARVEYSRQSVARLDFNNDKLVFLSELKPVEVIERSKQGRTDHWRVDKNLENGPLQLEGQVYSKGLALHSYTELAYALDGKYRKFEAVLGMDDMVGGTGESRVRIEADGREIFSQTIHRSARCQKLQLDVKGVRQLRIVVASTGLFDFGDHVDIANAKLSK